MENYETVKFFEESLENLKAVYRADPKIIVHDLHPGICLPSGQIRRNRGMKTVGIQHHYAHIGSVMAEHGLKGKVIGVAFDGTGYGTDGNLWGGEFLIADVEGFERAGQFNIFRFPEAKQPSGSRGGPRSVWSCGRVTKPGIHWICIGFVQRYGKVQLEQVMKVAAARELSPLASGAGRLSTLSRPCSVSVIGTPLKARRPWRWKPAREGIEEEYPVELMRKRVY